MALEDVTNGSDGTKGRPPSAVNKPKQKPADSTTLDAQPHDQFEIFQGSLLEHEFNHEQTFVSATLQRLQHGTYEYTRLQVTSSASINVTLSAVNFVFQPGHATMHRFKRAQITIQAFNTNEEQYDEKAEKEGTHIMRPRLLRIIKFAPHIVSG